VTAAHEVEHTEETLAVVEKELVPAAEEAVKAAERRVEAGEATSQEWVMARRAALVAKSRLVRARAEYALAKFRAMELSAATEER
jgi:outer membrane protein TolC